MSKDKDKDIDGKLDKIQVLQPQPNQIIRTFSNPVCKQTFYSLPRIYGKKKKVTKPETSQVQQISRLLQKRNVKPRRNLSSNQLLDNSKATKTAITAQKPHSYTSPLECNKKNCYCHKNHSNSGQKTRKKFLSTYTRQMLLPEIRRFDLEDLQSQHKVSMQGLGTTKANFNKTGLGKIIEQNQKVIKSRNQSPKDEKHQKVQKQPAQTKKTSNISKSNISLLKNKYKVKPKANPSRFQIQQQSDQQKMTEENPQQQQTLINRKNKRDQSARFKTQVNDSDTPKQQAKKNSISLNSRLFRGTKRQNTNFYELNMSQKSMEKKVLNRKPSQLSNGLFRIPQQDEYADYLRGYNSVKQNFNIKKIARRPGFKIEKNQDGVYFGQFDDELRKHGQGVNITDKEIFEGRYERDVKTSGCERNIDGVYIGEFKNGLRSGYGVFKWNNGQIFQGRWQNGMKNGIGIWKSPKGDFYEGQWVQNRQHGEGVFRHRTSTYKGEFKNFLKDGFGTQNFVNGDTYQGEYHQGKPHGKGRYEWHKGGYYQGQFSQGMREGRGKWMDQNGCTYEGYFKSDFKHGMGKQTYASGERFEGQFYEGARTVGKLYDKNNKYTEINQEEE